MTFNPTQPRENDGRFGTVRRGDPGQLGLTDGRMSILPVVSSSGPFPVSTGNDFSVSDEFSVSRTWKTNDPERPYITADEVYFVEAYDPAPAGGVLDASEADEMELAYDVWSKGDRSEPAPPRPTYSVASAVTFTAHTDPDDPGTEVDSYVEESDVRDDRPFTTASEATDRALSMAQSQTWQDTFPEEWLADCRGE